MRIAIYDVECFAYDWIVIFKEKETGVYACIHNDNEALREYLDDETIYISFNGKHYDQFIIKAIVADFTPNEIKQVSDFIISGGQGWEYPKLKDFYISFNNVDIKDDMQAGLSLKAIEGHLGLNIKETDVDFNICRPLSQEELQQVIHYCKHDVDATEKLMEIRKDYLKTKLNLGKRAAISDVKAISSTNAKLTAMMLKAVKKDWNDGRNYVYPENLDKSVIPEAVLNFFDTIHNMSIPDEQLFKRSLEIEIGGMPCKYAWGGVHGSLKGYFEESTECRAIQNRDVSSLYPSLIEQYNYLSRNVPNPELFYSIKRERIAAKHSGDKQLAKDLKLPLNTVSGAQENKYNDLYDPLPTRSLRISGQLFLTVLTMRLLSECKTIKLLNLNTDGLMYSIDKKELSIADRVCCEWETETRLELETDDIKKVWIKDVNNLLIIKSNGNIKTVGGYLSYGTSAKGAWSINNSMVIVKKAIIEYFVHNSPVEKTINDCDDIFQFQMIAKAGAKYLKAYHVVDGKQLPIQKVNRVYASKNKRYGKLFKVKANDQTIAKIEMLPEHCIIDNDNHLTIADIDKSFYIETAKKRIDDFMGVRPRKLTRGGQKKMVVTDVKQIDLKALNVYQKLLKAREKFLEADVKKSGKNMKLTYKYFELTDIVPVATPIFVELGLLPVVTFDNDHAIMTIINTDCPSETIVFTSPMREIDAVVSSRTGGEITNAIQRLGSVETYQRRYLYMVALDIVESDSIESEAGWNERDNANRPPATLEHRAEVKKELTNVEGNASQLQIKQLKIVLKKLKDKFPEKEEKISELAVKTQGFTVINKADCEKLIKQITAMLNQGSENK